MTDVERARAVVDKWLVVGGAAGITLGWSARDRPISQQFVNGLSAEFIAIRAEEREGMVWFLKKTARDALAVPGEKLVVVALLLAAARIEQGEHLEEKE